MRIFTTILICLIYSTGILGQTDNSKLKISHLIGDYYVYTTYRNLNGSMFPSNSMYLITEDGAMLFDTPWDTTQFQPLLDSIAIKHNKKVVLCIATHFHNDRTAGLDFLRQKGIKTYSSLLTYNLCKVNHEKKAEFYFTHDTTIAVGKHKFETYYPGEATPKTILLSGLKMKKYFVAAASSKARRILISAILQTPIWFNGSQQLKHSLKNIQKSIL